MILDQHGEAINKVTIDFETRSEANLLAVGAWNYARHPSTQAMCLSWRASNGESGFWHMKHKHMIKKLRANLDKATNLVGIAKTEELRLKRQATVTQILQDINDLHETPQPTRLFELIAEGFLVEAHNAFFERVIWQHVCVPRMLWPTIPEEQWRCSAAKASMHSLPRDLARASGEMCPDEQKDTEGHRLMLKMCKPAKPTKADPDRVWHEIPDELRSLWAYCEQDTKSEEALSESLIDLPPKELELWQMDQRMNLRGMYADQELAGKAIDIAGNLVEQLNQELSQVTHGELEKGSQRAKIKEWINGQVPLADQVEGTGAPVLERLMQNNVYQDTPVGTVVDIVLAVNRTSIKKYQAMLDRGDHDDHRIRDMMMYHGAGTGRWSGKGVQPHNFPRGFIKHMEDTCAELMGYPLDELLMFHSRHDLMNILSWALRGALCAPKGRRLYVADYAAIEARVLVWLADDEAALQVFRDGKDIYKDMAVTIYGVKYEDVTAEMRRMGKQAILGLGYQMGAPKFWDTINGYEPAYKGVGKEIPGVKLSGDEVLAAINPIARSLDYEDALKYGFKLMPNQQADIINRVQDPFIRQNVKDFLFVRNVVNIYRERYSAVKKLWGEHNGAAISAVAEPGTRQTVGRVTWYTDDNDFLRCELPSGRCLFYRKPHLGKNKFGNSSLYYWSIDAMTKQWRRTGTYGGKLVENFTQAVARDLMGDGMLEVDKHDDYDLLASVHDELIAEADEDKGDVEEFENLMATIKPWAEGCPVKAEGWTGFRYRK